MLSVNGGRGVGVKTDGWSNEDKDRRGKCSETVETGQSESRLEEVFRGKIAENLNDGGPYPWLPSLHILYLEIIYNLVTRSQNFNSAGTCHLWQTHSTHWSPKHLDHIQGGQKSKKWNQYRERSSSTFTSYTPNHDGLDKLWYLVNTINMNLV